MYIFIGRAGAGPPSRYARADFYIYITIDKITRTGLATRNDHVTLVWSRYVRAAWALMFIRVSPS